MITIDRRDFARTLASVSLGLLPTPRIAFLRRPPQQYAFIRRNVYCLNAYSPEIMAYKRAIQVIRGRPATDPTSWQAQSNIHGAFKPDPANGIVNYCQGGPANFVAPPGMIADACRHDYLFLAWHRIYLYYFERIVRSASGDPTFALPYWGYSPTGPRNLPLTFRSPNNTTNPLWTDQRDSAINAGNDITATYVDASNAMVNVGFAAFQSSLSGTPHGQVHVATGDGCGWMSYFETAGMDPIFWLHHANIDRLWEDWIALGGGRVNPTTDPAWLNNTFSFYDENGATVTMNVSQILDTASQLNYRYAAPTICPVRVRCFCLPWRPWLIDPRIIALADSIRHRPPLPNPFIAAQRPEPVPLGASPREIRLALTAETRARLSALPHDSQARLSALPRDSQAGANIKLVFDDIRLQQNPAVAYDVYVNLPAGADTVYTSPHYIGSLDFFGSGRPDHKALRREFDLVHPYLRLLQLKRWPADTLRVTLVPKPLVEGHDVRKRLGQRPQATIGRVSVVIE